MLPGAPLDAGHAAKSGWFDDKGGSPVPSAYVNEAELSELRAELLRLKTDLAAVRADLKFRKLLHALKAYNPNQPRVPAGNPDGGQWTTDGGSGRVRLAASERPRFGPSAVAAIAAEVAQRAIEAYRKGNLLTDLFSGRIGTVAYSEFNGEQVFGANSTSPTYTRADREAAVDLRDRLVEKYPAVMETTDVGRRPNDALFRAETTVLLRAARANGGALAGRTFEVHVDRPLCRSCRSVLPYVGLEFGNPTVTFIDPTGLRQTIKDGQWAR